jgi:putative acetyltransferase
MVDVVARPPVSLRPERPGEGAIVDSMVVSAFEDDRLAGLLSALRGSDDAWVEGLSFVAELDGEIAGHVLFTRSLLDAPPRLVNVLVLSPLSVRSDLRGRGIGSALVRHGLDQVRRRTEPLVFLEGSPAYYGRLGFVPGGGLGFRKPSLRIPDAAFQVLTLPAYEPWMTGTLVYADAFWRHDCVGLRDEPTSAAKPQPSDQ